ncbi:hypothetical protein RvY_00924-2 [Ramazzottius varieornatus]|uniref:RRM domain-containing protein n=1 Tax=Ramazzottius varieornatus TaxID=947166 RepID=A0A1D1UEH2_RAMVA|nr:hypothetical protein RvY_00924-2 [Ramazzottius varieornatus]
MAGKEGVFRTRYAGILEHRDELESDFQGALEAGNTKEELLKLLAASKKIVKFNKGIQDDIIEKLNVIEPGIEIAGSKSDHVSVASFAGPKATTNGSDQVSVKKNESQVSLGNPVHSSSGNSDALISKPAGSIQFDSEKGDVRQNYFSLPAVASSAQPQLALVNSTTGFTAPLSKKDPAPDNLKVFVPNVSQLSEQQLLVYFENFGHVQDVIKTPYPNKPATAIVRFINPESATKVLATAQHIIDRFPVYPKAFASTREAAQRRAENKQAFPRNLFPHPYQVYCGGISNQATIQDLKDALLEHTVGGIRDIQMPLMEKTNKHRGFAYVEYERTDDADYICNLHYIQVLGRQMECKANTRPLPAYLKAGFNVATLAGFGMASLVDSLPNAPSTANGPNGVPVARTQTQVPNAAAKADENHQTSKCIICKVKPPNCIMLWCGHATTCMDCGMKLENCPKEDCNDVVDRVMAA